MEQRRRGGLGELVWVPATLQAAPDAHRFLPELRAHDRHGNRIDYLEFRPGYHELVSSTFRHGVHAVSWTTDSPASRPARAVLSFLWNQVDGATACPTGMAYAAIPTLRDVPELAACNDRVARHGGDPQFTPVQAEASATVGYAMTEKQGGSDLRPTLPWLRPWTGQGRAARTCSTATSGSTRRR